MTPQQKFEQSDTPNITREGSQKLFEYLKKSDFFTAPASSRFHGNVEGVLVSHSVFVYERLKNILKNEYGDNYTDKFSEETIAIVSLLHDLCKIGYYKVEYRNVKDANGVWNRVPYYAVNDAFPYGHGEKSVYMINSFMRLTAEEAMSINWHMGGFDDRVKGNSFAVGEAFKIYPLAVFVHVADRTATYIDEKTSN